MRNRVPGLPLDEAHSGINGFIGGGEHLRNLVNGQVRPVLLIQGPNHGSGFEWVRPFLS